MQVLFVSGHREHFIFCDKPKKEMPLWINEINKVLVGETVHTEDTISDSSYILMGNLLRPDYLSQHLQTVLKRNNLKHIRYHDLRHSCASLLLANGVSLKEIQDWLGHSDFSTTANIYSHLEYGAKVKSANKIAENLSLEEKTKDG